jgi:two-component system chemotaxis response regulator CheB
MLREYVYTAPRDRRLLVERSGARRTSVLNDGPLVSRHRPAVDVLFRPAAQGAGPNAAGVLLTGMGYDGAPGLRELYDSGAYTIAQGEESSVVWDIPGEAVKLGRAHRVLPLNRIPEDILAAV